MKIIIILILCVSFFYPLTSVSASLHLHLQWDESPSNEMVTSYKIYRTDGTRTLVDTVASTPTFPYGITVTVPDTHGDWRATFVVTAINWVGESGDSRTLTYPSLGEVTPGSGGSIAISTSGTGSFTFSP